ncbi:MAG: bifunctional riboflavin kinase/FAD synthetase [bacterium]
MEVYHSLIQITQGEGSRVTVGSFDGLHLGHQRIFNTLKSLTGGVLTVLTFKPHPQAVIRPQSSPPPLLTSDEERIELFREIGVERLIFAPFDLELAEMEPEWFVREILLEKLRMETLVVGENHKFGKGRQGDVHLLQDLSQRWGFGLTVVEAISDDEGVISSTRIRKLLLNGRVREAIKLLGRPYKLHGLVVPGTGRGNSLGFPTANLKVSNPYKLIPRNGIYATWTEWRGDSYPSVTHVGPRPTFEENEISVETYIPGFSRDLYGEQLIISFVDYLREVMSFSTSKALVEQMEKDVQESLFRLDGWKKGVFDTQFLLPLKD